MQRGWKECQSQENKWKSLFLPHTNRQGNEGEMHHVITLQEWTHQGVSFSSNSESFIVTVPEEQTIYLFVDKGEEFMPLYRWQTFNLTLYFR
jgi:hypothetical protein